MLHFVKPCSNCGLPCFVPAPSMKKGTIHHEKYSQFCQTEWQQRVVSMVEWWDNKLTAVSCLILGFMKDNVIMWLYILLPKPPYSLHVTNSGSMLLLVTIIGAVCMTSWHIRTAWHQGTRGVCAMFVGNLAPWYNQIETLKIIAGNSAWRPSDGIYIRL